MLDEESMLRYDRRREREHDRVGKRERRFGGVLRFALHAHALFGRVLCAYLSRLCCPLHKVSWAIMPFTETSLDVLYLRCVVYFFTVS
jgi:hypothetical protein